VLQNIVARAGFVHSLATGVNFVYTVANALFLLYFVYFYGAA